jgi:hypothetical protein
MVQRRGIWGVFDSFVEFEELQSQISVACCARRLDIYGCFYSLCRKGIAVSGAGGKSCELG